MIRDAVEKSFIVLFIFELLIPAVLPGAIGRTVQAVLAYICSCEVRKGREPDQKEKKNILSESMNVFSMGLPAAAIGAYNLLFGSEAAQEIMIEEFIFAALSEEIIFRGIIFEILLRALTGQGSSGKWTALLLSSVLFGFAHLFNWKYSGAACIRQAIYTVFLGCYFGIVYMKTDSVRDPILLHIIINFTYALRIKNI